MFVGFGASGDLTARKLRAAAPQLPHVKATVGLDGFVDNIIAVVDKRHDLERYDRVRTIDGKPQATETANDTLRATTHTDKPFHIGRRGASLPFKGKLDDVQLYGLALTAENAGQLAAGQAPDLADTLLAVPVEKRTPAGRWALRWPPITASSTSRGRRATSST